MIMPAATRILGAAFGLFFIYCELRILRRMGFEWPYALILLLGPFALIFFAFKEWPVEGELRGSRRA